MQPIAHCNSVVSCSAGFRDLQGIHSSAKRAIQLPNFYADCSHALAGVQQHSLSMDTDESAKIIQQLPKGIAHKESPAVVQGANACHCCGYEQ